MRSQLPDAPPISLNDALEESAARRDALHRIRYLRDGARRFLRSYNLGGSKVALAQARDWWESANKVALQHGLEAAPFFHLEIEVSRSMSGEVVS